MIRFWLPGPADNDEQCRHEDHSEQQDQKRVTYQWPRYFYCGKIFANDNLRNSCSEKGEVNDRFYFIQTAMQFMTQFRYSSFGIAFRWSCLLHG
jgi:hypothetical protein